MRKTLLLFTLGLATAGSLTCSPAYVLRAGYEEAKILAARRPIDDVAADPASDHETRRKLELVREARVFAQEVLGLEAGDSFTTFSPLDRDTLALVLSAARKDRLEQVTWWFPIIGHVPYKGFFSLRDAEAAAAELERKGYDTYVRPTAAFSTLGWFNDPLLPTVLGYDDVRLVATVIHELTHNTIYLPSRIAFNESFASFVGDRGAIAFFCAREGPDSDRCRIARDRWADNLLFGHFLQSLSAELEAAFAREGRTRKQRLADRERIYARARNRFARDVEPALLTPEFRGFGRARLDNASLIAWRLYFDRLGHFERVYERTGQSLPRTIRRIADAAERDRGDPYAALGRLARD